MKSLRTEHRSLPRKGEVRRASSFAFRRMNECLPKPKAFNEAILRFFDYFQLSLAPVRSPLEWHEGLGPSRKYHAHWLITVEGFDQASVTANVKTHA